MTYSYIFKCIIIGDANVGKSCFLMQFIDKEFQHNQQATIAVEFGSRLIELQDKIIKLHIWDTAGQESYRSITTSYYRGTSIALLVYDITRRATFDHVQRWLGEMKQNAHPDLVVLLIGNKMDLTEDRQVSFMDGWKFADTNNLMFMEASAKTGEGVEDAFIRVTTKMLENIHNGEVDPSYFFDRPGIKIGPLEADAKNKGKCC